MSEKYYVYPGIFGVSAEKVEAELKELSLRPELDVSVEGDRMSAYVTASATAESIEKSKELCNEVIAFLREKYGDSMYTEEHKDLWHTAVHDYSEKKMTFALAESCTGGLISKMITDVPGASGVFSLGVVSYSPEAKMNSLRVKSETIEKQGVVSAETACEMAEGIRLSADSDVGIGVTGYAGPGDGDERYGRGTVFIALSDGRQTFVRRLKMPKLDRSGIRRAATLHALYMLHAFAAEKKDSIGAVMPLPTLAKPRKKKKLPFYKRFLHFFTDFPKDPIKEKLRKTVFFTAIIVMLYAGFRFGEGMYYEYRHNVVQNEINDLVEKGEELTEDERQQIIGDIIANGGEVDENISNWALLLYQKNPDLVGRVSLTEKDGTVRMQEIIVQGESNDEYLRRDFQGYYNTMGCSFMDSVNSKDASDPNTILYGHSTESGEKIMTGLHRYKKLKYLNENPLIKYETLTDESYYKIFAVIILDASPENKKDIFNDCYYRGETVYEKLESIRAHSMYDTAVDVNDTDKIITISTCTFEMDDLRLIIMARKVREGESLEVEPASVNRDAIFFDGWENRYNTNDAPASSESSSKPEVSSKEDVSSDIPSVPDEDKRFEMFDVAFFCATATTDEPSSVRISAAYISDFDSDCTVGIVTYPSDGNVKIVSSSNSITYTPDNGYSGMDSFEISLSDRTGMNYDTARVYVYVGMEQQTGVSVANDILYLTAKAGKSNTVNIQAVSVAGEKLTYEILKTEGLYSGTAEVDENGKVTYTSIRDERYQDVFKVLVTDESGNARMVEIRVNTAYDFEYETEI